MVTNETQEQLEARGWDFTEEFIPDVSENGTIEYLDVSGLEEKSSIATYAILVKVSAMGSNATVTSGLLAQYSLVGYDLYMSVINGTSAVAIDASLEIPHPTTSELVTIGDIMREVYGSTFDSLPRLTKEQFYDVNS